MSYEQERKDIETRFKTQWAALGRSESIAFEGVPFDGKAASLPYVALFIRPADADQVSLGPNPVYRHPGVVIVQCFTPRDKGMKLGMQLADAAASVFRGWRQGGLRFRAPSVTPVGEEEDRLHVNMTAAYVRDQVFA